MAKLSSIRQLLIDRGKRRSSPSTILTMDTESTVFLSDFCSYYTVFSGEEQSCVDSAQGNYWSEVNSTSSHEDYLEYYEEGSSKASNLDIITIQPLETEEHIAPIISSTEIPEDYFTNIDLATMPISLSDPASTVLDLENLTDSCPFDWDLNLENLITTKSEALPDLSPIISSVAEICGDYSEESSTIVHQDYEESQKSTFQCTYSHCRKVYAKAAHLRSHIRRHLGDKPYICTWQDCSWRFNRSDELARHRRSHSGHKPYGCDYCVKRFSRSDHLSKHRKVHERKFATGKAKGVWRVLPKAKPGRKPKAQKELEECQNFTNFSGY